MNSDVSPSPRSDLAQTLERAGGAASVAASLAGLGWMHQLVPAAGRGEPVPGSRRVFVDADALHEHAAARDDVRASRSYETRVVEWFAGLVEFLRDGVESVVLDAGRGVEHELSRTDLGAVVAAIASEWFVEGVSPCVLMQDGRVYYYANRSDHRCAFVFESAELALEHLDHMRGRVDGLHVGNVAREVLLDGLLSAGVSRLFVNPGLDDQRSYDRASLEVLRALVRGEETRTAKSNESADEHAAASSAPAASDGQAAPVTTVTPRLDPTAGPGRNDAESRARLLEIKALSDAETRSSWVVTELIAHDLDVWVPLSSSSRDGNPWPAIDRVRDANGADSRCANLFSNEAMARAFLERAGRGDDPLACVVGVEAMRWLWSTPGGVDRIVVDPNARDGDLSLTERIVPPMLFPPLLGVHDLGLVPAVDWDRLATLPNVHGLKPEVVRAFVERWSELSGPPRDGSQDPIQVGGKHYLPAFTHTDRYYEYSRRFGTIQTPQVAGTEPPFLSWLRLAARCDGVVLDPAATVPLTLGVSELFYLHLWAANGRAPDGAAVASTLALLQTGERPLDQRTSGRIAADWPLYVAARTAGGSEDDLLVIPGTADLALFTSERQIDDFVRMQRRELGHEPSLEPVHLLPRWRESLFSLANERYSGVRIDPGSTATRGGVHLDGKGLDGALAGLEERLRPRVPGFGVV